MKKNTFSNPPRYGTDRANAVDGIRRKSDVRACYSSDVSVAGQKRRYWMVDLAGLYKIHYVNITIRVDFCGQ